MTARVADRRRPAQGTRGVEAMTAGLILKRAPIGPNVEYYDVLEDGRVVGCIFLSQAAPVLGLSWKWASGHNGDMERVAHGHEPTRKAAMAAFAKSWRQE